MCMVPVYGSKIVAIGEFQTKQRKNYVYVTIDPHSRTIDPHSCTIDPHFPTIDTHLLTIDPYFHTIDPYFLQVMSTLYTRSLSFPFILLDCVPLFARHKGNEK
jgi:hypothetical protein